MHHFRPPAIPVIPCRGWGPIPIIEDTIVPIDIAQLGGGMKKAYIDKLVNIYIDDVLSIKHDAGWEGESMLGRLIDFAGDIPPPSGNDQSNVTMMGAIRLLRGTHAEYPKIAAAIAEVKIEQALAILAKHYFQGLDKSTEKPWSNGRRAEEIGQNLKEYQYNLGKAYDALDAEITRIDRYQGLVNLCA